MASTTSQNFRRYALTGSVAAITATGAWYGAGLKARQEFKQERQAVLEATLAEKTEQLEIMVTRLKRQRLDLQTKIDRLDAKPSAGPQQAQHRNE